MVRGPEDGGGPPTKAENCIEAADPGFSMTTLRSFREESGSHGPSC